MTVRKTVLNLIVTQFTVFQVVLSSVLMTFTMMLGSEYCPRFIEENTEGQGRWAQGFPTVPVAGDCSWKNGSRLNVRTALHFRDPGWLEHSPSWRIGHLSKSISEHLSKSRSATPAGPAHVRGALQAQGFPG